MAKLTTQQPRAGHVETPRAVPSMQRAGLVNRGGGRGPAVSGGDSGGGEGDVAFAAGTRGPGEAVGAHKSAAAGGGVPRVNRTGESRRGRKRLEDHAFANQPIPLHHNQFLLSLGAVCFLSLA